MLALGELGLSVDYFYSLTPRLFNNIVEGFFRRESRLAQAHWEQARLVFFGAIKPHLKDRNATADKILPFPWETNTEETERQELTAEESQKIINDQKAFWANIDQKKKVKNGKFSAD